MSIGANQNVESGGAGGADIGGSVAGGRTGSILFVGANGTVQQDNPNLYWDDATNRLGIGTTAPTVAHDVNGTVRGTSFVAVGATAGSVVFIGPAGILNINPNNLYWDNVNNRLAIGNSSPIYNLDVLGNGLIDQMSITAGSNGSVLFYSVSGGNGIIAQSNTSLFFDLVNVRLGIGTAVPISPFHLSSSAPEMRLSDTQASGRTWLLRSGASAAGKFDLMDSSATVSRLVIDTSGNVGLAGASAGGAGGAGALLLSNAASAPTTSTDMVQLWSEDLSAGNATLGMRTETAVAVDASLVSSHSLQVRINGATYKIPLVAI